MSETSGRRQGGRNRPTAWVGFEEPAAPERVPLTRRRIVEAAVALVDGDGLAVLSFRRLAAELAVTPMAIYGHVADKDQLLDLMLDYVLGEVDLSPAHPEPLVALRALILDVDRLFERHRGMARIYGGSVRLGPNGLRVIDAVLGHLLAAGLRPKAAAAAFLDLYGYTVGHHQLGRVAPESPGAGEGGKASPFLSALPAVEVPHLARAGRYLFSGPPRAERFERGLDLLLDGLRAAMD